MDPLFSDEISSYFGLKISMYFAWLGHYTAALAVPATCGSIFWVRDDSRKIIVFVKNPQFIMKNPRKSLGSLIFLMGQKSKLVIKQK